VLFGGSIMGIFAGIYHYFPKMFGRMMSEKIGTWHFWLNFIAMNLTFFPMHFSGLLGMPRRIYTYDAGQGWDTFNLISSIGAFMLVFSTALFVWNFFMSKSSGPIATDNPWDAATLEWSIPSPPPEYNFAEIPLVESRYPLWDLTHPERTSEIPHTHDGWSDQEKAADAKPVHIEKERRSAKELGIPMPLPTIKPFFVALGIIVMLSGLLFIHRESKTIAFSLIATGASMLIGFLYAWLTSPLEEAH
jgi:cytochrome c oxidase subunit 1